MNLRFGLLAVTMVLPVGAQSTLVPLFYPAASQPRSLISKREVQIQGPGFDHMPHGNGGRVAGCEQCQSGGPVLWTIDINGLREETVFEFPEPANVSVWDVAAGQDGALAVVGYATTNDSGFADFVAWISPDRKRKIVTRVGPYHPYVVTIAPDGTIWTVGPQRHEDSLVELHANVLRHFEPSGKLIANVIVNRTRRFNGIAGVADGSTLMASNDRIGWLTHACDYIEFSFTAAEMGRYTCPNGIPNGQLLGGTALSFENDLLIGGKRPGLEPLAPLQLNRNTGNWAPVPTPANYPNAYGILGFDGMTLVTYPKPFTLARFLLVSTTTAAQE